MLSGIPCTASHCQPQLISDRHQTIGRDGRQLGEVHPAQTLRPLLSPAKPAKHSRRGNCGCSLRVRRRICMQRSVVGATRASSAVCLPGTPSAHAPADRRGFCTAAGALNKLGAPRARNLPAVPPATPSRRPPRSSGLPSSAAAAARLPAIPGTHLSRHRSRRGPAPYGPADTAASRAPGGLDAVRYGVEASVAGPQ